MNKKVSRYVVAALLALSVGNFTNIKANNVVTDIAKVNDVTYDTLQAAANKATDGSVITMLKDASIQGTAFNNGNHLTLDLNGHQLEADNTSLGCVEISNNTVLTLQDSKNTGLIVSNSPYSSTATTGMIYVSGEHSELIMNSGTIKAVMSDPTNKGQFGIVAGNGGDVTINGGVVEAGWYAISGNGNNKTQNSQFTVNGGKLISVADYAIYNPQSGGTTVNGGVVYGAAGGISINRGTLNITGGIVTSKGIGNTGDWGDGTGNQANSAIYLGAEYGDVVSTITGGTITAENKAAIFIKDNNNINNLTIVGGLFSSDVTKWLDQNYKMIQNTDGKYKVVPKTTSITLPIQATRLEVGKTYSLQATLNPAGAVADIVYASNDDSIASVDNQGLITAKKAGVATITVTADGKNVSFVVTVYEKILLPVIPDISGNNTNDVVIDKNAGSILQNSLRDIIEDVNSNAISSDTKKALLDALNSRKQLDIKPNIKPLDKASVDKKIVDKIEKSLGKEEKVAQFFSLSMLLTADGKSLGTVNELTGKIKFTITLDKNIMKDGKKFYVVTVHDNGVAERLEATLVGNKLTFETSKFSTFAVVEDNRAVSTITGTTGSIQTGDHSNIGLYISLLGVSLVVLVFVKIKKYSK